MRLVEKVAHVFSLIGAFLVGSLASKAAEVTNLPPVGDAFALDSFAQLKPIDAHVHIYKNDAAFNDLIKRLNLHLLNICVIDDREAAYKELEPQRSHVLHVRSQTGGAAAFCTTFSPYDFEDPRFKGRVFDQLDEDFVRGAVAVKIYKTIGMEIKTRTGKFLMADDPVFDPIYERIADRGKTLIAHLAEPTSCWEPPDPASPDYGYYQKYPAEYAYLHPEYPTKASILKARDQVLARHPRLRMVGAHLGSMERNVDDIAARFDHYSNFAVDTAARMPYLMSQPRDKVRAFLIRYQDRVLYGTDLVFELPDDTTKAVRKWSETYERDWKYLATDQTFRYKEHEVRGLNLPAEVLRKLYRDNALRWIPGI